ASGNIRLLFAYRLAPQSRGSQPKLKAQQRPGGRSQILLSQEFHSVQPIHRATSYEVRTDCKKPASFAVTLYCGIGSRSLNALVNAFDRLHIVRGWNSS